MINFTNKLLSNIKRSPETQQALNGLLQRDQVAIPTLSRWVLVVLDHASTQWWVLECLTNQHQTATDEGTWEISLLDSVGTRRQVHSGSELLSPTGRITEPETKGNKSGRDRQGHHQVRPQRSDSRMW